MCVYETINILLVSYKVAYRKVKPHITAKELILLAAVNIMNIVIVQFSGANSSDLFEILGIIISKNNINRHKYLSVNTDSVRWFSHSNI